MSNSVTPPVVHLGGTSRKALHEQWGIAREAAVYLMATLADARPHPRDYVNMSNAYYIDAMLEHMHMERSARKSMDYLTRLIEDTQGERN